MTEMTLHKLAEVLSGRVVGQFPLSQPLPTVGCHSIDSRTLNPGEIFWALPGSNQNGHAFVADALRRGASLAVVAEPVETGDGPQLLVADVQQAMTRLAVWQRQQQEALLIGVTGSVGKTTTRHLIYEVLASQFSGMQSLHNYNNALGVPLSLLSLAPEHEFGVLELGASARGEIAHLAGLVEPEIGVLTEVGPAHLDGFGSVETVLRAKAELLAALPKSGFAVLPYHLAEQPIVRNELTCRVISVGESWAATIQPERVVMAADGLHFSVDGDDYHLQVAGRHFLNSALISLAIGRELELTSAQIQAGFARFQPIAGRCQLRRIGGWQVLDDTYNASPLAMQAALAALQNLAGVSQRIAVLGDMLCLGETSTEYHRQLGRSVALSGFDHLLVYGEFASVVAQGALQAGMSGARIGVFETLPQLQEILSLWLEPRAGLLLKASRNMRLERLLSWLQAEAEEESLSAPLTEFRRVA